MSPPRLLHTIRTPWPPYSVMFSHDGSRLAIGGGTWYGQGGIVLADMTDRRTELFSLNLPMVLPLEQSRRRPLPDPPPMSKPTASGVCFSADDRHLAVSMWRSSQQYAPSALFDVRGLQLNLVARCPAHDLGPWVCSTGIVLYQSQIITRNHRGDPEDVITIDAVPRDIPVAAENSRQQFTHIRTVVVRDTVITETGGSRGVEQSQPDGSHKVRIVPEGLIVRSLLGETPDVIMPVADCGRVTAIALVSPDDAFITGGRNGELDRWSWEGRWRQRRLRDARPPKQVEWSGIGRLSWVAYSPISIVGVVALPRRGTWASVSAGGELTVWTNDTAEETWQLSEPGSPRSLAAHPHKSLIAVGIKQGSFDRPASAVAIIEVD